MLSFGSRISQQSLSLWNWTTEQLLQLGLLLRYFLRAFGLRALNHLTQGRHEPEHPKFVLQRSFWIAFSRCAVHLVPTTALLLLTYVNWKTFYIGPGFSVLDRQDGTYNTLFQIAAKVVELFCVASMGTILLDLLRSAILHGRGAPLGLVSSHIWFSQPSSLLSPEYLAPIVSSLKEISRIVSDSIKRNRSHRSHRSTSSLNWNRTRLVLLIFILILLAATVGPFTAVLLIPRDRMFPAGGTRYFLNATAEELWPSIVDVDMEYEACFWPNATQYSVCPSGGYASLLDQRSFSNNYDSVTSKPGRQADSSLNNVNSLVRDPQNIMPAVFSAGQIVPLRNGGASYACQPNMYSAVILQTLVRDWDTATWSDEAVGGFLSSISEFKHAPSPFASATLTYPLSQIRCTEPQNLTRTAEMAEFRYIKDLSRMPYGWGELIETKSANLTSLRVEPTSHIRAQWVQLPSKDFFPVSIGLLLELPWSQNYDSRLAVACSVVSSWVQGEVARAEGADYLAWHTVRDDIPFYEKIATDIKANDPIAVGVQRPIQFSPQWLDLLTPEAPDPLVANDTWRPTTLENLFALAGFETLMQELRSRPQFFKTDDICKVGMLDSTLTDSELWNTTICNEYKKNDFIEWTVARLVSDGLSRRLSHRAFDTVLDYRSWAPRNFSNDDDQYLRNLMKLNTDAVMLSSDPNLVVQRLDISVKGLCYGIVTQNEYLAIVVVALYLLLSCIHIIWTLTRRVTSSSWDTPTELMLLAHNSRPSKVLHGTSAQVHRWHTYNRTVTIRAEPVERNESAAETEMQLCMLVDEPDPVDHGKTKETRGHSEAGSDVTTKGVGAVAGARVFYKVKEDEKYY